MIVSWASH